MKDLVKDITKRGMNRDGITLLHCSIEIEDTDVLTLQLVLFADGLSPFCETQYLDRYPDTAQRDVYTSVSERTVGINSV